MAIDINRTLDSTVQQLNPLDKIGGEAHLAKSATQKRPVYPVESLLLVKREDCDRDIGGGGVIGDITEEKNVFTYISARDSAALVGGYHSMDDLEQTPRKCPGGDLVIDV